MVQKQKEKRKGLRGSAAVPSAKHRPMKGAC